MPRSEIMPLAKFVEVVITVGPALGATRLRDSRVAFRHRHADRRPRRRKIGGQTFVRRSGRLLDDLLLALGLKKRIFTSEI